MQHKKHSTKNHFIFIKKITVLFSVSFYFRYFHHFISFPFPADYHFNPITHHNKRQQWQQRQCWGGGGSHRSHSLPCSTHTHTHSNFDKHCRHRTNDNSPVSTTAVHPMPSMVNLDNGIINAGECITLTTRASNMKNQTST